MELRLTPEAEAKLNNLAQRTHRDASELLEQAVDQLIDWTDWIETKVNSSIAAAKRRETTPDDDVLAWLEKRRTLRCVLTEPIVQMLGQRHSVPLSVNQ